MEAEDHDQQDAAMMPLPERFATATTNPLSPSDLMIASESSEKSNHESRSASTIALARINRLPLLHWLIAAINGVLHGEAPAQPRPVGILIESGRFVADGTEVWAYDWYGHERRCLVARCPDAAAAEELGIRLNIVLRP